MPLDFNEKSLDITVGKERGVVNAPSLTVTELDTMFIFISELSMQLCSMGGMMIAEPAAIPESFTNSLRFICLNVYCFVRSNGNNWSLT